MPAGERGSGAMGARGASLQRRRGRVSAAIVAGILLALTTPVRAQTTPEAVVVSRSSASGTAGAGSSGSPAVSSRDGSIVAFESVAEDLATGDANGAADVFVRDGAGVLTRVSVASGGGEADGASGAPAMSGDGRLVVFESDAANLVGDDTNGVRDVFLHDRTSGETKRVSVTSGEDEASGASSGAAISSDGGLVAFSSVAPDLVAGDANEVSDVFVRDVAAGTTVRVSDGGSASWDAALSGDGAVVAFTSEAPLGAGDTNGLADVYVRAMAGGTPERVSLADGGGDPDGPSGAASLGRDGAVVAFESGAGNLVAGDANRVADVFMRDRAAGVTERVSVGAGGGEGDAASGAPAVTGDGRFVVFESEAANLASGDGNGAADVFVRDRSGSETRMVSATGGGAAGAGASWAPAAATGAGRLHVAFVTAAGNLADFGRPLGTRGDRQVLRVPLDFAGIPMGADRFQATIDTPAGRYEMGGDVTALGFTLSPHSGETVTSVQGYATVPGATGGAADVYVDVRRFWFFYLGVVRIRDWGANGQFLVPVITTAIERLSSDAVGATLPAIGLHGGKLFVRPLTWRVDDLV